MQRLDAKARQHAGSIGEAEPQTHRTRVQGAAIVVVLQGVEAQTHDVATAGTARLRNMHDVLGVLAFPGARSHDTLRQRIVGMRLRVG